MAKNDNVRKAAVLLMSLPEEEAAAVMSRLEPKQVESVSIEIAQLGRVDSDEQESVIHEFTDENPNALGAGTGGLDLAKNLLQKALGNKATEALENVLHSVEALPFGFLKKIDPQNLHTFLTDEHPQTIALILSHLPASFGSEIIAGLTSERQMDVVRRIANMGQTSPDVISEVERGLKSRMSNVVGQSYENAGGVPSVAEILNVSDRATERALLENLAQEDPDLVEEIRRLMFVFEDITKLQAKDIQSLLKNVETAQWAMALKGASEDMKDKILGNMSQRAAQMLSEEIDYLGPVRVSEVESVQQQIVDVVRRLEDAGEITIGGESGEDEFVD